MKPKDAQITRREFAHMGAVALSAPILLTSLKSSAQSTDTSLFPTLATVADKFRFVLIADPQVEKAEAKSAVARTSQEKFSRMVSEINAMDPAPAFVVVNGDLVNSAQPGQMDNFLERARQLKPLTILVHGNHDGHEPYPEFRAMQRTMNGVEHERFSFDCGEWHFVTIPCNFKEESEYEKQCLDWLERDLFDHRERPTIAFIHYNLMPQGLTQLEWYTYRRPFRTQLLEILSKYGNVKHCVHGHVHNGIQTAHKLKWNWRGIDFLTAPTCTASRNFGEDFAAFKAGLPDGTGDMGGGYYLVYEVNGKSMNVRGRMAGVKEEHSFHASGREYAGDEPLWFQSPFDLPLNERLLNPDFRAGLESWYRPYRYLSDQDPAYRCAVDSSLNLYCREKGQAWAHDERMEVYQSIKAGAGAPMLRARYRLDEHPEQGGGYFRIFGLDATRDLKFTWLMHWAKGDTGKTRYFTQNAYYTALESRANPWAFAESGVDRKGIFPSLPMETGSDHDVEMNLAALADHALGTSGGYDQLGIQRFHVACGVWANENPGAKSGARIHSFNLEWGDASGASVRFNGTPTDIAESWKKTDYGYKARDKENKRRV